MKKIFTRTTLYSILIILAVAGTLSYAFAASIEIPLNAAPYVKGVPGSDGLDVRGQAKTGQLTIGSGTVGSSPLTVVGPSGLHIESVSCGSGPCPYTIGQGPELRVLQAGYSHDAVVGAPISTQITPGAALDIRGQIQADPRQGYLSWPQGSFYSSGSVTSTVDKPICATDAGDLVVCGTGGQVPFGTITNPGTGTVYSGTSTPTGGTNAPVKTPPVTGGIIQ